MESLNRPVLDWMLNPRFKAITGVSTLSSEQYRKVMDLMVEYKENRPPTPTEVYIFDPKHSMLPEKDYRTALSSLTAKYPMPETAWEEMSVLAHSMELVTGTKIPALAGLRVLLMAALLKNKLPTLYNKEADFREIADFSISAEEEYNRAISKVSGLFKE